MANVDVWALPIFHSRNRLVMEFLLKLGYVERLGAGIALMTRRMVEENGQPPEFEVRGDEFRMRLPAGRVTHDV